MKKKKRPDGYGSWQRFLERERLKEEIPLKAEEIAEWKEVAKLTKKKKRISS